MVIMMIMIIILMRIKEKIILIIMIVMTIKMIIMIIIDTQFAYTVGATAIMLAVGMIFYSICTSFLLGMIVDFFSMQVYTDTGHYNDFLLFLKSFAVMFTTFLVYSFFLMGGGLLHHSTLEMQTAQNLLERIREIKIKRSVKGLEME